MEYVVIGLDLASGHDWSPEPITQAKHDCLMHDYLMYGDRTGQNVKGLIASPMPNSKMTRQQVRQAARLAGKGR